MSFSGQSSDLLVAMRSLARRGADAQAAELADKSGASERSDPTIALECARARMRQGDLLRARVALIQCDLTRANAGQRLILALESASLLILEKFAIRVARKNALEALEASSSEPVRVLDRAEAQRVYARIELSAAVLYEAPQEAAAAVLAELPKIADILESGGRLPESMAARLTFADRQPDLANSMRAFDDVIRRALALDMPDYAAEALLYQSGRLAKVDSPTERIRKLLAKAVRHYETAEHRHGLLDVRYAEARLAVNREFASTDTLLPFYDEYLSLQYPRGAMVLLMDLSQMEHVRGNMPAAEMYRSRATDLSETFGMKMTRDTFRLGKRTC